jgi:hypothetical protein
VGNIGHVFLVPRSFVLDKGTSRIVPLLSGHDPRDHAA